MLCDVATGKLWCATVHGTMQAMTIEEGTEAAVSNFGRVGKEGHGMTTWCRLAPCRGPDAANTTAQRVSTSNLRILSVHNHWSALCGSVCSLLGLLADLLRRPQHLRLLCRVGAHPTAASIRSSAGRTISWCVLSFELSRGHVFGSTAWLSRFVKHGRLRSASSAPDATRHCAMGCQR